MVKILNLFGDSYSGQAGKAGVFAKWKGRQYRRKYVIPANPKTQMQMTVRGYFTNAVAAWHTWHSLQRLVFSYLATGLVMSGFNLLVSRWQKAATTGATLPTAPKEGIKQIASAKKTTSTDNGLTASASFNLTDKPVVIGSLTYTKSGTDPDQDAYVDLEMGDIRIPVAITKADGAKGAGNDLVEGDQLVISYTSGGRTVTREVVFTIPATPVEIPARVSIDVAFRTKYYPVDFGSVVVETHDIDGGASEWTQLESLEIEDCYYTLSDSTVVPAARIYFDLTTPTDAASKVDYYSYTAIEGAKLEITKVDTSFITWRRYSDGVGQDPVAQTIEDETYDWVLSAPAYVSVLRAAQTAILASKHECVVMTAAS